MKSSILILHNTSNLKMTDVYCLYLLVPSHPHFITGKKASGDFNEIFWHPKSFNLTKSVYNHIYWILKWTGMILRGWTPVSSVLIPDST